MTIQYLASVQQAERALQTPAILTVSLPAGTAQDRVKQFLSTLVARHELLRSRLLPAPGSSYRLVQEVAADAKVAWHDTNEARWVVAGTLKDGPLRVEMTGDGDNPLEVRLSLPSGYVDLGGLVVLAAELQALAEGQDLVEPVQNSQYAAWQADNETSQRPDYPAVPVPAGRFTEAPVDADPTRPYLRHTVHLVDQQWESVAACARRLGVGVDTVLLGAWVIGQARRGDARVTGIYTDHRRAYSDLAETVGVLSRYLPFPVRIADDEVAEDVLRRVGGDLVATNGSLDTFTWSEVPRGLYDCDSRAPAWPTLFASHPVPSEAVVEHATLVEPSHAPKLCLQILYTDRRARVELLHHPQLVTEQEGSTLLDSFLALLAHVVQRTYQRVAELRTLGSEAQRRVLEVFGHAPEQVPLTRDTAYHLIAAQVERTPDRVAVTDGNRRLTYRELHTRAAQIAVAITAHDMQSGGRVALLMARGVDMVAAVLGVWRAGMSYVPIDVGTPAERMAFLLADSRAQLLLTDVPDAPEPPPGGPTVLRLTDIASAPDTALALPDTPHDDTELAYVIYTSGTTGLPKGVMVEHRSVVNLARAHQARIYCHHVPAATGLRASLNAPLAFDGAVERILLLASGCSLFIIDEETRHDPAAFVAFACWHDLQVLDVTPSLLVALIQAGILEQPDYQPRVVLVGGEAIGPALWRTLAASSVAFYNVYGPTETTVNAAVGRVTGPDPHLGRALPNVRLYILDTARQSVPPGVPGEIHVAGAGVGRGYLDRPELTARSFVPNPFAPGDQLFGRMYATGDIGRFNPDGSIEYLGRRDGQVKLRGFRIETGEIAALLSQEVGVTDALVRMVGDPPDQQLVAYVVAHEQVHEGLAERLRKRLVERLPTHTLPSLIVPLTAWPLSANGKVDIDALPILGAHLHTMPADFVAPRTDLEAAVARIWSDVLDREHVGVTDNFFEVGGHSLLVPVLLRRVSEELGVPLPLRTIFTAATVADLARKVSEGL